jgi:hypothetical protein
MNPMRLAPLQSPRMAYGRIGSMVAISVLVLVAVLGPGAPAGAARAWNEVSVQTTSGQDSYFNDVTVAPGGTVWAVGYRVAFLPGATEFRTNIQRSTGGGFHSVAAPDVEGPPAVNFLNGVAASAANEVWAVGWVRDRAARIDRTRILRWNGTAWSAVASPNPGTVRNTLFDVAVTGDTAFAVGTWASSFYNEPLVLWLDGSTWRATALTRPAGCDGHAGLSAVHAVSPTDVWAIGHCESGANPSFVLRFDGATWNLAVAPAKLPGIRLRGFAPAGDGRLFAVGGSSAGPRTVRVFPGPTWIIPGPSTDVSWAGGTTYGTNTLLVGSGTVPGTSFSGPVFGTRTSQGFTPRSIGPTFGYFNAAATGPDGTIWAVGAQSGKPLAMRRTP